MMEQDHLAKGFVAKEWDLAAADKAVVTAEDNAGVEMAKACKARGVVLRKPIPSQFRHNQMFAPIRQCHDDLINWH